MLQMTNIPTRNPQVLGRMADNEAVLVMPQKGQVKVLNEVGAAIWETIDGQHNIAQIVNQICAQFDIDQNTAETDTLQFIAELLSREIVSILPA